MEKKLSCNMAVADRQAVKMEKKRPIVMLFSQYFFSFLFCGACTMPTNGDGVHD